METRERKMIMDDRFDDVRTLMPDADRGIDKLGEAREIYQTYSEFYGMRDTDPKIDEAIRESYKELVRSHQTPELLEIEERHPFESPDKYFKEIVTERYKETQGIPTPEHEELKGSISERIQELSSLRGIQTPGLDVACEKLNEKMKLQSEFASMTSMFMDRTLDEMSRIEIGEFIRSLDAESKLEIIPKSSVESMQIGECSDFSWREEVFRPLTGYVNINMEMVDKLAEALDDKKCLEVMSGNGLLSRCLQDRNVDIIATDKSMPIENSYLPLRTEQFTDIRQMDALDAIREYGKDIDILVMSWPPYGDDIAYRCVETLHEVNPEAEILYIGELWGGCNADDAFFNATMRAPMDEKMYEVSELYTPYYGLHDDISILKYVPVEERDPIEPDDYYGWDEDMDMGMDIDRDDKEEPNADN